MKKLVLLCLFVALLAGCATQPKPLYYWMDYSDSLYKLKKEPGDDTFAAHKATLHKLIEEADKQQTQVPPGVCCELGYMYLKENNAAEAIKLFRVEQETYPESAVLMERLITAANSSTAKK